MFSLGNIKSHITHTHTFLHWGGEELYLDSTSSGESVLVAEEARLYLGKEIHCSSIKKHKLIVNFLETSSARENETAKCI